MLFKNVYALEDNEEKKLWRPSWIFQDNSKKKNKYLVYAQNLLRQKSHFLVSSYAPKQPVGVGWGQIFGVELFCSIVLFIHFST